MASTSTVDGHHIYIVVQVNSVCAYAVFLRSLGVEANKGKHTCVHAHVMFELHYTKFVSFQFGKCKR